MNFAQKLALFILILVTCSYIYFSFFAKNIKLREIKLPSISDLNPIKQDKTNKIQSVQRVKIFLVDNTGKLHSLERECNENTSISCFSYALIELLKSPSNQEKIQGFTSEIPQGTKILSIRESDTEIMIDLSSDFNTGGGTESNYMRMRQLIKTVNANTKLPVYLYINGNKVNVFGGEGIMIKQPLNGASLDE